MSRKRHGNSAATAVGTGEPRLHSHVTDGLPADHPLATTRLHCDRCDTLLHLRRNACVRTWVETGCGNFCLPCFIDAAGGLAADEAGLAGVECLPRAFGLPADGTRPSS